MTMLANKSYVVIYYHKKTRKTSFSSGLCQIKKRKQALSSLTFDASHPLVNTGTTTVVSCPSSPTRHGRRHGRISRHSRGKRRDAKLDNGPTLPPTSQGPRRFTWDGFFPGAAPGESRGELRRTAGDRLGNLPRATGCSLVIMRMGVDDAQETDR
jgi:hypothetical protein